MNENESSFDLTDSILRILGIIGFFTTVLAGFVLAGGNLLNLIHPPEIIIVVGTTCFGLLCTHRKQFLVYLPKALLACVQKPLPNREFCQICDIARSYAAVGGGMAVILSLICTMSNLEHPEQVGLRVAAAMSGVFVAMLLSQGLFVYLRYSFSEKASG